MTPESPAADRAESALEPGHQLGPYRLLALLGEGGFGSVYLAEQREPIRRRVALKLIKLGMDTRQVIARFEAERQALAMMTHSNIARMLDVGATETGRPYFVMELVSGVPITEYCEKYKLGLEDRLRLFEQVCSALQHAHQKGVIHRDIKPSNILVGAESGVPVPKVIDFGIAKATQQALTDKTLVTLQQQMLGTPTYMSPEQTEATGLDLDTRSDIYALGVLLYELLTGSTPFDHSSLDGVGLAEMLRIIRTVEPHRPSVRAQERDSERAMRRRPRDPDLARRLRGDLDWIVMRCLEKDPTRRYGTASELAADVCRHLADEPVLAGPPSAAYRLRKFTRRHRAGVLVGAVVLSLLVVGVVGTTWGWLWALEEQVRADALATSEKQARLAAQESATLAHFATERATLEAQRAEEASRRAEQEQRVSQQRADELQLVVGLQEAQLHELDSAALGLSLRDRLVSLAGERDRWAGLSPQDAATNELQAQLAGLDFTGLALSIVTEGVLDPTLEAVTEELAQQPLVRARMQHALAAVFLSTSQLERAESAERAALETRRAMLGPTHPETLASLHQLGQTIQQLGRHAEALEVLEQCSQARQETLGPEHSDSLATLLEVAGTLRLLGRLDEAREHNERVLETRQRLFDEDEPDTLTAMAELAETLFWQRDFELAENFGRRALAGRRALLGDHHQDTLTSILSLGRTLTHLSGKAEALQLFREAEQLARSSYGERHLATLEASQNLGDLLCESGSLDEAEIYLDRAYSIDRLLYGDAHAYTLSVLMSIGRLREAQGRRPEADQLLQQAWLGMRRHQGEGHTRTTDAANFLGSLRLADGRLLEAEPLLVETAHVTRRDLGHAHWRTVRVLEQVEDLKNALLRHLRTLSGPSDAMLAAVNGIVGAQNALDLHGDSEKLLAKVLPAHEPTGLGISPWLLAESASLRGEALAGLGRRDEAHTLLLDGFASLERHPAPDDDTWRLSRAARRLARFYESGEDEALADDWWQRARALEPTDG